MQMLIDKKLALNYPIKKGFRSLDNRIYGGGDQP
jgi:hypothetical protein